jgi:hypothetical protein
MSAARNGLPVDLHGLAARLRGAYVAGPVAPLRDGLAPTYAESAYAVQALNTALWNPIWLCALAPEDFAACRKSAAAGTIIRRIHQRLGSQY